MSPICTYLTFIVCSLRFCLMLRHARYRCYRRRQAFVRLLLGSKCACTTAADKWLRWCVNRLLVLFRIFLLVLAMVHTFTQATDCCLPNIYTQKIVRYYLHFVLCTAQLSKLKTPQKLNDLYSQKSPFNIYPISHAFIHVVLTSSLHHAFSCVVMYSNICLEIYVIVANK